MPKTVDYKKLVGILLDRFCDYDGVSEVIYFLFKLGYTKENIIELKFKAEDFDDVINNIEDFEN